MINSTTNANSTGKAGLCIHGILDNMPMHIAGINFTVDINAGEKVKELISLLPWKQGPEVDIVEIEKDEKLLDVDEMITTIRNYNIAKNLQKKAVSTISKKKTSA